MKRILQEAALVLVIGAALSLIANAISPRGLNLTGDYFPAAAPVAALSTINSPAIQVTNAAAAVDPGQKDLDRVRAKGLQAIAHAEAVRLFQSPEVAAQKVIFVDARSDPFYEAGHVPGAWLFDHYRPEKHLATVVPVCMVADKVVVYCTGGDCEDSVFAALTLIQAGVPKEKVMVYVGGIGEWKAAGQPLETGARASGVLVKTGQ